LLIPGREGNKTELLRGLILDLALEDRVSLLGPRDDLPDLLAAADVFVLPSRWEGFPGVIVEAMALEAPVVATDLGGVREALGETFGELVPPEDESSLADALARTLSAPPVRVARLARERFLERFTVNGVADRMHALYQAVASNGRKGEVIVHMQGGATRA
jgi:glycosyltransferase involved in cell wall biosynthesis